MPPFSFLVCLLLAQFAVASNTLLFGSDRNITEWFWQTSIAVSNYLYITAGEYYNYTGSNFNGVSYVPVTMVIDLTKSFTNSTITATTFSHDASQDVRRPMLWYDQAAKKVYKYGGWPYNVTGETYSQNLYSMAVDGNGKMTGSGWTSITATGANGLTSSGRAPGGAAFTYTNTTFFSLGGSSPDIWSPQSGFVLFNDTSTQWTNKTSVGATSTGYWSNAAAVWASGFGSKGYLLFVGGTATESAPGVSSRDQLIDMSTVTLYDINSSTWYQQPTTGDVPPARNSFCYTSATTTGTFELFIYGGSVDANTIDEADANDTGYLNVFTLSLPAFRWFKSSDSTAVRRANHYCTTIGNRQMISIGGSQPSSPLALGQAQDPWANGIGIFDMTAFKWSNSYDPNAAKYESPDVVKSYYSSSYTTPSFANPTLAAAFGSSTKLSTSPTSSVSSSPSASASSAPSSGGSSSHTGAIAGGVVGGVILIALIALAIFCFRRRSRRTKTPVQQNDARWMQGQQGQTAYQESSQTKPYDSGYADGGTYSSYGAGTYQSTASELPNSQPPVELGTDPIHRGPGRFTEMPS